MTNTKSKIIVPSALLEINTDAPPRSKPRPASNRPEVPSKFPDEQTPAFDPFSVLCAPPPPPLESRVPWGRRLRNVLIGKGVGFCFWHILLPGVFHFGTISSLFVGGAALLAAWGGYTIQKAPDTEQGRAVARALGDAPKSSVATRLLEPIKTTVAKPAATIKEGAKKAVEKAEGKADELKSEVKEEATEIKGVLQGLKAEPQGDRAGSGEPDQQPGLLVQAGKKISDAKDAVVGKVTGAFQGEQLMPEQLEKQRELVEKRRRIAFQKYHDERRRYLKRLNAQKLAAIGSYLEGQYAIAVSNYNAWCRQREAEIGQMMQASAAQANENIRSSNLLIRGR